MTRAAMLPAIRGRVFLVSMLIIAVVGTAVAMVLSRAVQGLVEGRIENELRREVQVARIAVEAVDPEPTIQQMDALADRLGEERSVRVSLLDRQGRVLGDSWLTPAQLAAEPVMGDQPEVVQALQTDARAVARRHSPTLGRDMVYVASPFAGSRASGVLRLAVDLEAIDEVVRASRLTASGVGFLALVFAVLMSGFAGHLANRNVEAALERVREALDRAGRRNGRSTSAPTPDELAGLAGGVQDLADRLERAVGELAAERARFGALLDQMSEAVLALDREARIVLANPAAVQLLGLQGQAEGRLLVELIRAPQLVGMVRQVLAPDAAAAAGDGTSAEVALPGGRTVLATARPLSDGESCVLVLHDVTDIRRLDKVRRDFVANVSHELRTPVAIIRANAESLVDGALEDPKVARSFLDGIVRNAQRLSLLIADLLDLSRIEAGRAQLSPRRVDAREAAAWALDAVRTQADGNNQQLSMDIADGLALWVDPQALEHVLLNLVENAVKYTPPGGKIRVVGRPGRNGEVFLAVEDDGPGIPESQRPRVFERFYRVDSGRARQQGGTGLGLAIVKHLAESMGGSVGVEARRPRGSSFQVRLPSAEGREEPGKTTTGQEGAPQE